MTKQTETNQPRIDRYGESEVRELAGKDPILGKAMAEIGMIRREVTPDLFEALVSSIVSQQIAKKAYFTVWGRVQELAGKVTPQTIQALDREALKACGLSYKKTDWIKSAAQMVCDGQLDLESLKQLPDEEVIRQLIRLPGIGVWTAEMLLIFSLERPDIISFGDLAIRRGIQNLYGLSELTKKDFAAIRQRLSPHNTIASLYFWELSREAKAADPD